jgi:hypothetical protein
MTEPQSNTVSPDRMWRTNPATKLMDYIRIVPQPGAIALFDDNRQIARIDFGRVVRLVTFKRDLITTDVIVLAMIDENGDGILVHEEMPGFQDLFEVLSSAFAGIKRDWYMQVMTPAFATNSLTIWERTPDQPSKAGK